MNENDFHKESVDILACDEDHSMNSTHFIDWIEKVASYLRFLHGAAARIAIITDNEAEPSKRSWRKDQLQQRLEEHRGKYDTQLEKA